MFNTMNPVRPNPYQLPDGNGYGGNGQGNENQGNQQQPPQTVARGRAEALQSAPQPMPQHQPLPQYQPMPQYQNNAQYQSYGVQNPIQAQPLRPAANPTRSNKINIAQILRDFNNTIKAIGTPPDLCDKVNEYLFAVGSQVKKENPAVNMIQSNLKNAAIVLDKYISETLNKDSKVVQNWLDALFLQRIDYHYNEDDINRDFLVKFPEGKPAQGTANQAPPQPMPQAPIQPEQNVNTAAPINPEYYPTPQQNYQEEQFTTQPQQFPQPQQFQQPQQIVHQPTPQIQQQPLPTQKAVELETEPVAEQQSEQQKYISNPVKIFIPKDKELKDLFIRAKKQLYTNNSKKAMDLFQKALERATQVKDKETESKICYEIGKIYDDNDCLVQALNSYNRSSNSTTDSKVKTRAHFSMAQIYDDVNQVEPAINHYFTSISYAGQMDNFVAQSASLTKIANIFSCKFDEQAFDYYEQADTLVNQTTDSTAKGFVSSNMAEAYNHFEEPAKALHCYRDAIKNYTDAKSTFNIAKNYKDAAGIMLDYNQSDKAKALLTRAEKYADKTNDEKLLNEIKQLLQNVE